MTRIPGGDAAGHDPPVTRGTAAGHLLRSAWRGATRDWRGSPAAARRSVVIRLIVATVAVAGLSAGSAVLLSRVATDDRLPGDAPLSAWIEPLLGVHSGVWLGAATSSAMVVPVLALAAVLWARAERWERTATSIAAFVASKAIILAGWTSWARPRPADVAGGDLVPAEMSSYPSGHTLQTWTVYGLLVLWWTAASRSRTERVVAWTLLVPVTAILGAARVRIGAHHPSDVIGGAVLGALWLLGAAWAERAASPAVDGPAGRDAPAHPQMYRSAKR
jgi:membrane-associated phospholipid phosphatase